MATDVLRRRGRSGADSRQEGRGDWVWIARPRARAEPARQRRERQGRSAGDEPLAREGDARRA